MKRQAIDRIGAGVLSACLLGLASSPAYYILLFGYQDLEALLVPGLAPAFLPGVAGSVLLLVRFLSVPQDQEDRRLRWRFWEAIGWLGVVVTLWPFVLGMPLFGDAWHQAGAVSLFVLLAAAVYLPVVLLRNTALERRLRRLPRVVILSCLVVLVGTMGGLVAYSCLVPSRFILM